MKELRGIKPKISADRDPLTKAPPVPTYLSSFARSEWHRIMPRLIADRIITRADLGGIEELCIARGYVREVESQRTALNGPIDPKLFGVLNRAVQTARQLAAEYGLSPTSRARFARAAPDDDDDNPLAV